jgi:hypothetical protein
VNVRAGFSYKTVHENIARLERDDQLPRAQATAIAFAAGRVSYFKRHPEGALPRWLAYTDGMRLARHYHKGYPLTAPSQRAKNPVPPSGVAQAMARYRAFSGHEPESVGTVEMPATDARALWVLGELDFVGYTTVRDGAIESYKHTFKKKARPLLAVTADGGALVIVEGKYHVTERGIEDKSI